MLSGDSYDWIEPAWHVAKKSLFKDSSTKALTTLEDYSYKSNEIIQFKTKPILHIFQVST